MKDDDKDEDKFYRILSSKMNKRRKGKMLGTDIIDFAIEALGGEVEDEDTKAAPVPEIENEGILVGALDILINALGGEPEPIRQSSNENESGNSSSGILGAVSTAIDDAIQNAQDFVENLQNDESSGSSTGSNDAGSNGENSDSNADSESNEDSGSSTDSMNTEDSSTDEAETSVVDVTGIAASLIEAINQAISGSGSGSSSSASNTIVTETEVVVIIKVINSLVESFKSDGTFGAEASSIIISTITAIHSVYVTSSSKKDETAEMIVQVLTSIDNNLKSTDTSDVDVAQLMQVVAVQIMDSYAEIEDGGSIDVSKLSTVLMTTITSELGSSNAVDTVSLLAAVTQSVNETASGSSSSSGTSGSADSSSSGDSSSSSDSSSDSSSSDSSSSDSSSSSSDSSSSDSSSSSSDSSSSTSSTQSSTTLNIIKTLSETLQLYSTISSSQKGEILIKVNEVVQTVYQMESEVSSSKLIITLIEEIVSVINTELADDTDIDTNIMIVAVASSIKKVFTEETSESDNSAFGSLIVSILTSVDETVSASSLKSGKLLSKIISGLSSVFSMTSLSGFTSGKVMISVVSSINEEISSSSEEINVGTLIILVFKEILSEFESFSTLTEITKEEGTMIFAVVKAMNEVLEESSGQDTNSVTVGQFLKDITKIIHDVYDMNSDSVNSEDLLAAILMVVSDSVEEDDIPSGDSSSDIVIKIVTTVITDKLGAGGSGSGEDITASLTEAVEESITEKIGGVMVEGDSINSYGIAAAVLIAIETVIETSGETDVTQLKFSLSEIIKVSETLIKSSIGVEEVVNSVETVIRETLDSSASSGEDVTDEYIEAISIKINNLFEEMTIVNAETVASEVVKVITEVSSSVSTAEVSYDVDLIVEATSLIIKSNLSNEGGVGEQLLTAAAAAIQNVQDGGNGEGSDMDEIAMAVIAAVNDAIAAGMSSTEEIIDVVVTAVLAISGIENEDIDEVIATVMQTIEEILGIEEEENIVVNDQIEDENLTISEASEITNVLLVIINAVGNALEEEDDGLGVDITDLLVVAIEKSITKSVSEKLSVELIASSVVIVLEEILLEQSQGGGDITFDLELIYELTEITVRKQLGVNDVVEVASKVILTIREFISSINTSAGTDVTISLQTVVESALQKSLSSSGAQSVTAGDVSNSVVEALQKTVESETAGGILISVDEAIIVDAAKTVIVKYLGVDIFLTEITSAIEEIITIGGDGAGKDITELLIITVRTSINTHLGDATEDDNDIVTAQRLAYLMRISLIQLISEIGSYEEMSYETQDVIKAAQVEIREYFSVVSGEDDNFDIMNVVDGAVSTICEMLGVCPGESSPPPPLPEPACSQDFIQYEDSCIYVSHTTTARNWVEAQISCTELHPRANLASVHNPAELDFIRSNCSYIGTFFLGGTDAGTEGVWRWNNGRDWSYDNWRPGQPAGQGRENCMEMDAEDGFWNDVDCGGFAGRCVTDVGCRLRDTAPPKRYVCSYALSTFKASDFTPAPVDKDNRDQDCGPWAGVWPETSQGEQERPGPGATSGIAIVQAPNVPIIISNNPASNIPIELPTIVSLPFKRKKSKENKRMRSKKTKKNKARKNGGKKEKKKQEKRKRKKKDKIEAE